jgi:uncharacterized membrane protein YwaF
MSLKLKAALQTLSIIAVIVLTVFGLQHLSEILTVGQIGVICSVIVLSSLAYIMYLILLNRLEYEQKIDKLTKD